MKNLNIILVSSLTLTACGFDPGTGFLEEGTETGSETDTETGNNPSETDSGEDEEYNPQCCHCLGQVAVCDSAPLGDAGICEEEGEWSDPYCTIDEQGNPVCPWSQVLCEQNPSECGNGVVEQGEMCDGQNTEYTCTNLGLFDSEPGQSVVTCGDDCLVDVSECEAGQEEACCFCGGGEGKTCFPLDNWEECVAFGESHQTPIFWSDGCKIFEGEAFCPGWSDLACDPMAK